MPSITVGVLDATGQIDTNADPGGFLVIGKSLTSFATDLADQPISPLRGYIGVGNGLLSGPFAGVEWQFTPKTSLMAEYINKVRMNGGIDTSTVFNIGARFGITDEIKADVSWLDLKDLGVGIVYTKAVEL
jgi:hypothetical protein